MGAGFLRVNEFEKGARIIEYTGRRVPWKGAQDLPPLDQRNPFHTVLFSVGKDDVIDPAIGGNEARWINHSCDPNCETYEEDGRIFVHALRGLGAGEELFYDYKMILAERRTQKVEKEFACYCGAKKCRRTMLARRKVRRKN